VCRGITVDYNGSNARIEERSLNEMDFMPPWDATCHVGWLA
jgi:hypothetical protein